MPRAVILTALSVEYMAVRAHLTNLQEELHPQGTIYERGVFAANGQDWEVGIAEVGAGNAGSAIEAERAIAHFKPDIICFVGIAGGIKDVAIGDVVAATDVYGYESGKVGSREKFSVRPKVGKSSYALVQRAKSEARKTEWLQRLSNSSLSQPNVFVAPIAAGEKVIASRNSKLFQFLRDSYNDAIAVEMEGFGFLSAAFAYPDIQAIVIRGISDLIQDKNANDPNEGNEEDRQKRASQNASAFAFEVIARLQSRDKIFKTSNAGSELERQEVLQDHELFLSQPPKMLKQQVFVGSQAKAVPLSVNLSEHYMLLEDSLSLGDWKRADQETRAIIFKACNRFHGESLDAESIRQCPDSIFRDINQIWLEHSQGRFGFSTQQAIWKKLEEHAGVTYKIFQHFSQSVGWYKAKAWIKYEDLNFTLEAPLGHLPYCRSWILPTRNTAIAQRFHALMLKRCFEDLLNVGETFSVGQYNIPQESSDHSTLKSTNEIQLLKDIQIEELRIKGFREEITQVEEQIKAREQFGELKLDEVRDWLSETKRQRLAARIGKELLKNFPDAERELNGNIENFEYFYEDIADYLKLIYYSLVTERYNLLHVPAVSPVLSNPKVYVEALNLIKSKMPPEIVGLARQELENRFDYLSGRLLN